MRNNDFKITKAVGKQTQKSADCGLLSLVSFMFFLTAIKYCGSSLKYIVKR